MIYYLVFTKFMPKSQAKKMKLFSCFIKILSRFTYENCLALEKKEKGMQPGEMQALTSCGVVA